MLPFSRLVFRSQLDPCSNFARDMYRLHIVVFGQDGQPRSAIQLVFKPYFGSGSCSPNGVVYNVEFASAVVYLRYSDENEVARRRLGREHKNFVAGDHRCSSALHRAGDSIPGAASAGQPKIFDVVSIDGSGETRVGKERMLLHVVKMIPAYLPSRGIIH